MMQNDDSENQNSANGAAGATEQPEIEVEVIDEPSGQSDDSTADNFSPGPSEHELALQAEIRHLEHQLRDKQARMDEVYRAYRHAEEEFKRSRERLERELRREVEAEKNAAIALFFEVADNLDRSMEASRQSASIESLREGLELVSQQFARTLEKVGVQPIQPQGQPFNPDEHEAVGVMPVPGPEQHQTVVNVYRTGYRLGNTVLRPAMVLVGQHNG